MSGDVEAAGNLIGGTLLARAVEPVAGKAAPAGHHPAICLNCGTGLIGPHCHRCGQSAHVHRTVTSIGHEIAHGVFHLEGKIWRTLPMLLLHPGRLTRRYIDGERARFVSPLALFLFTVFLLFATISWVGGDVTDVRYSPQAKEQASAGIAAKQKEVAAQRQRVAAARAAALAKGASVEDQDEQLSILDRTAKGLTLAAGELQAQHTGVILGGLHTGWTRLDSGIAKANANPGLALYKLQSSAYKFSWLLIPLSVPFVAMLFLWRRRFGLYDHAIFVTYSLSFMMLMVVALTLLGAIGLGGGWLAFAALALPPVHMFVQLRGTYLIGKFSAAWRTAMLLGFSFAVLLGFCVLLLLHGLTE